jgi:hypothetical protein
VNHDSKNSREKYASHEVTSELFAALSAAVARPDWIRHWFVGAVVAEAWKLRGCHGCMSGDKLATMLPIAISAMVHQE